MILPGRRSIPVTVQAEVPWSRCDRCRKEEPHAYQILGGTVAATADTRPVGWGVLSVAGSAYDLCGECEPVVRRELDAFLVRAGLAK